jgi:hypothetical protein
MRMFYKAVFALALMALVAHLSPAQQPRRGGRGGGGGGLGMLLQNKDVQKELNLSDEQAEKAKKTTDEVQAKHKDESDKIRELPREDQRAKRTELGQKVEEETIKALADTLKPEQVKRLEQIVLQQAARRQGPGVFLTPKVEKALSLSDKQKDDLKTMSEDYRKQAREAFQPGTPRNDETRKKMAEMRKEAMDNALKVLDDKQKQEWQELTGKEIEIRFERRPRSNQ